MLVNALCVFLSLQNEDRVIILDACATNVHQPHLFLFTLKTRVAVGPVLANLLKA